MKKETDRFNYRLLALVFSMVFIFSIISLKAANYVTVATIGNQVPAVSYEKGMQNVVDQITGFWHKRLQQVLPDKPDLIVLPEYCDIPKGMGREIRKEYLKVRQGQITEFFAAEAKANQCYIAFGIRRELEDGTSRNSCVVVDRQGKVAGIYDKNFPTAGDMKSGVKSTEKADLIRCDFGTIACAICFDLNFVELMQKYVESKPDIIIFPSMYHGGLVQSNWAYSCRSYFIGSMAFREIPSEIRNPLGEVIASNTNYFDYAVARINLDRCQAHLDGNWEKLAALKNKYGPKVTIKDPGRLGSVLITSEHETVTADQMVNEFEIELLDDYFDRSRECRLEPDNME